MATIDELTRLDQEIRAAEHQALANLAAHLREAVLDMPSASALARMFVQQAEEFEYRARARFLDPSTSKVEFTKILRQLRSATREDVVGLLAEAMSAAASNLDPADPLSRQLQAEAHLLRGALGAGGW